MNEKLNFDHHITEKISKVNKGIDVIKKVHHVLPGRTLLTIYKLFIKPNMDYGDLIWDQRHNNSFCSKIECVQYTAALAITGSFLGTSQTKICSKLGLGSFR